METTFATNAAVESLAVDVTPAGADQIIELDLQQLVLVGGGSGIFVLA